MRQPGFSGCALLPALFELRQTGCAYPRRTVGRFVVLSEDYCRSSLGAGRRAQLACANHAGSGRGPSGELRQHGTPTRRTASAPHAAKAAEAAGFRVRMMRFVPVSWAQIYERRSGDRTAVCAFFIFADQPSYGFFAQAIETAAEDFWRPPNPRGRLPAKGG